MTEKNIDGYCGRKSSKAGLQAGEVEDWLEGTFPEVVDPESEETDDDD